MKLELTDREARLLFEAISLDDLREMLVEDGREEDYEVIINVKKKILEGMV